MNKLEQLQAYFEQLGNVAIAYSSGVDSTFLLKVASDTLGNRAIAITVVADAFPKREQEEAKAFCEKEQIRQICCTIDPLSIPGFAENPPDRCYICKKKIFTEVIRNARECGITNIAEGTNADDQTDYRPGMRAIAELGIYSPLKELGFSKQEIRMYSKELGLPTWSKPSYACLASRFVYGETITREKLGMVDAAEQFLISLGYEQMRVRMHGQMARIEVPEACIEDFMKSNLRESVTAYLKQLGFSYVTLDLQGYRTGSMNEVLAL